MFINRKQVPSIILAVFPDYNGHKFEFQVTQKITLANAYWDGGSRSFYKAVNLLNGQITEAHPALSNPYQCPTSPTIDLPKDTAIIEHSIFCGRDCGITIYLHPDNAATLLPSPITLTQDEKIILCATRSFVSSYAGIKEYRFKEAKRTTGITWERWCATKDNLITNGFLTRSGAITTKGKNAIGNVALHNLC